MESTTTSPNDEEWSASDLLPSMYLIFGILGLLGNGVVLFVFIRVRWLRNITNLFIANQSLIDLVSSIFLLATKYRDKNSDIRAADINIGGFFCRFWTSDYIFWALLLASTANLVLLTMERYTALVYPLTYRNRVNWYSANVAAVCPWLFGFVFQSYWPAVHRLNDHACYPHWPSPAVQAVLGVAIFVIKHLTPICVMVVVYVSIIWRLKSKVGSSSAANDGPDQNNGNQTNQKQQLGPIHCQSPHHSNHQRQLQRQKQNETPLQIPEGSQQQHPHKVLTQHHGNDDQPQEGEGDTNRQTTSQATALDSRQKVRRNVIKTLFLVAVVFAICWTPNQLMFLFYNLGFYDLDFNSFEYVFGVLLTFCNIWINPFIYTFKYRKFQKGLRKVFCNNKVDILIHSRT